MCSEWRFYYAILSKKFFSTSTENLTIEFFALVISNTDRFEIFWFQKKLLFQLLEKINSNFFSELLTHRNDSGSGRDSSPTISRAPSRNGSALECQSWRMSYVPPGLRKNSSKKSAISIHNGKNYEKTMSALSKRSVRKFDDKKYHSNSHLTPVNW